MRAVLPLLFALWAPVHAFADSFCEDLIALVNRDADAIRIDVAEQMSVFNPSRVTAPFLEFNARDYFPEVFSRALHARLNARLQGLANPIHSLDVPETGNRVISGTEVLSAEQTALIRSFVDSVVNGINTNRWGERVAVESLELRSGSAAWPLRVEGSDPWHRDQSYMTVTLTLVGTGTQRPGPGGTIVATPTGHCLLIGGTARREIYPNQVALVHRSPPAAEDRLVLILRLRRVPN